MSGLQFAASIVNSLAWPAAVVAAAVLLRPQLVAAFHRMRSLQFPGGKVEFDALADYEKISEAAVKNVAIPVDRVIARSEEAEFSVLDALAEAAPQQAIIDGWTLLEYQLNLASDRVTPDQPHGWPQVARNLEAWDKWPVLYPVVAELRRLRDYTARSGQSPSSSDAARYVSVVQDLVTALRAASRMSPSISAGRPGGGP